MKRERAVQVSVSVYVHVCCTERKMAGGGKRRKEGGQLLDWLKRGFAKQC